MARRLKRRSSRRLRRNDAAPAAPSSKKKMLVLGGIGLVAAGGAAYLLLSPSSASAQSTLPTGPTAVDPQVARAAKAAECDALRASLVQLRSLPTPDRTSMTRLEGQIAACLAQARELGAPTDPAASLQAAADVSRAQIDGWFDEYKATNNDLVKRNNTRQSILAGGAALAATYAEAIVQSPNNQATTLIAQSIVRALDSAITRRICFLNNERGCGTQALDEDQPDAKGAQEQARVIVPLVAAYMQAVTKVGGPRRALAQADGEKFLAAMLRPCTFLKSYIDGQWGHYRATNNDPLKRNNTRQSILADGRTLVACLQTVWASAYSFGSMTSMRAVGKLTLAALNASIDRWRGFFLNEPRCGTFALDEDQPDVKAAQEMASTTMPLISAYAHFARTLSTRGEVAAYEPLITAKLRICAAMKGYVDGQFDHYRATKWSDALKRNNTRQSILAAGAALAACLREALVLAQNSGDKKLVRPVAVLTEQALLSAIRRKLCYLYDQTGCGRFALNEDHGNDKAAHEQDRVIGPLVSVYKQAVVIDKANTQAEAPLARALLEEVTIAKNYLDSQYGNLKATDYSDSVKRNNIRGSMVQAGQRLVSLLRDMQPTTPAGRALARSAAQAALTKSRERETCYRAGAGGCDRQWGTWTEPSGGEKADQERDTIGNPLAALLADTSKTGLGGMGDEAGVMGLSSQAWLGIGAVGALALLAANAGPTRVRRNRRSERRTSRR